MYAIVKVIYGVPLNFKEQDHPLLADAVDDEVSLFEGYYNGGSDTMPRVFGVELDTFDEAAFSIDVSSISLEPTEAQLEQYREAWEYLDPELRAEVQKVGGEPRVFFLWTSS